MHYLLFNNETVISDGKSIKRVKKGHDLKEDLENIEKACVCMVDVDVLIAASVEFPVEKKDGILVRKFKEFYHHENYIIQDEKIDTNLFQVMGIKEQKVREVYSLISEVKIVSFVPYGLALRNTLINKRGDLNTTVVFVEDLGSERLLTVFDGLKFSRTRVIANNKEDILPEIKRSQIDFFKKTEEFLIKNSADFIIIVNTEILFDEISKNNENLTVEHLNVLYPALEGLKTINSSIKFRLPEENIKKRRDLEVKKRIKVVLIALGVITVSFFYFLFNQIVLKRVNDQCVLALQANKRLDDQLNKLDKEIYREDLKEHKSLNYGIFYLSILEIIPATYTVGSFDFYKTKNWNIDLTLFADEEGIFDPIPLVKIMKNAQIKDVFVNNQPGKYIKIVL